MNDAPKSNNLLGERNNRILEDIEKLNATCTRFSAENKEVNTQSSKVCYKVNSCLSPDTRRSSNEFSQSIKIQQDYFSPFGSVKFYGVRSTSLKDQSRNTVRIVTRVTKPATFTSSHWPPCSFFGMYTGHSGSLCASFLKNNLHNFIFSSPYFPHFPKKAIIEGFIKADAHFLQVAEESCNFSGAFALIVLIIGKKCYVANTGKIKALISMNCGTRVMQVSTPHSPENLTEAERIIAAGGKLYKDFTISKAGEKQEIGTFNVIPGKKDFTRSFGDPDSKIRELGGIPEAIIVDPYIKSFKISELCDFILVTSESVSEVLSDQLILEHFWKPVQNSQSVNPITARLSLLSGLLFKECKSNSSILLIGLSNLNYE